MAVCFGKLFVICLQLAALSFAAQVHTHSRKSSVLESGIQSAAGLTIDVVVPSGEGPFPVVILLGGIAFDDASAERRMKDILKEFSSQLPNAASTHIQVSPQSDHGSWNVVDEPSSRDDTTLIGTGLTEYISTFSNVQPTFKLVGFSNGAALVNRILIENDTPLIVAAVTCSSQLNQQQWHDGQFYIGGDDNSYSTPKQTFRERRVLQLTGGDDYFVPPNGGVSNIPSKLTFLSWTESAYHLAQAYGYQGVQTDFLESDDLVASVSYLRGQVQAYNVPGVTHHLSQMFAVDKIEPFLLDSVSG